jgi:hypothetical protein
VHRLVAAAGTVLVASVALVADAAFLASTGFSGRYDIDCSVCHTLEPLTPPATLVVDGVPDAYEPGATYRLHVEVTGGPPPLPALAQGGVEADVDAGRLRPADPSAALLRNFAPHAVTYTQAGAMVRAWDIEWTAPGAWRQPSEVNLWIATVAANGNHVVALNVSDGGERFDAVATGHWAIRPTSGAVAAWRATPLALPVITTSEKTGDGILVAGEHADANATIIAWRVDGGTWQERPAAGTWRLEIVIAGGTHTLEVRSVGAERTSEAIRLDLDLRSGLEKALPAPPLAAGLVCLALAACRRR